ncbi:uncharacterized protein BO97DRAFT_463302 [Aspergillus homomorphus CBS 101889]|uniref:Protein kinase domain-containing protein n=1 Tax=Aspergillus homomorphus (strain CBS 101889) TaxID=1450537 RepID=A0A395IAW3_ASPHC|nr:hypothetical protein BO97DRAFT_463302 [Aspergillus homomorphus CBS 101889]RAL15294.1 hypothetical protein BO97DRAFT_463302 [Aspergillus homomorphus CBS 101889]
MNEEITWRDIFFSGNPPRFLKTKFNRETDFLPFNPVDKDWKLSDLVDTSRPIENHCIQVFWLRSNRHRRYIGKVFPDFTREQVIEQLHRLGVKFVEIPRSIDDAVHQYDRFLREARAYSHIDKFCPGRERLYFPRFYGVVTNMERSRFSSGYAHPRAVVLEAVKPHLGSRRVLGEVDSSLPESFLKTIRNLQLSQFEHEWYSSLLRDRLRRLNALHKLGVTHGDVKDHHFRLPGDIYDTVLYDFSESYTFSDQRPFRVNSGKP